MNKKRTVLFMPLNFVGPVNCCVGMGQVLLGAGHHVVFAVQPEWQQKLTTYGNFSVEVLGPSDPEPENTSTTNTTANPDDSTERNVDIVRDFLRQLTPFESTTKNLRGTFADMIPQSARDDPYLAAIITRVKPDVIIADHVMNFPSILLSGIPWVFSYSSNPLSLDLCHEDRRLPPSLLGLSINSDKNEWEVLRSRLREVRLEVWPAYRNWLVKEGCQPDQLPLKGQLWSPSPYANVYMFTKELDYTDVRPLPETYHRFDYCMRTGGEGQEPFVVPDCLRGKPGKLIYFSLGSMGSANVELMRRLVGILANSPHRFIVSKGVYHDQYALPDNMWGARTVPQLQVLGMVDLLITHGGNNTVTECMYHGKPMVVMPLFWNQYDNAQRVHEQGFGVRMDPFVCTAPDLLATVDRLLGDKQLSVKLAAVSHRIQTEKSVAIHMLIQINPGTSAIDNTGTLIYITNDDQVYGLGCNHWGSLGLGHFYDVLNPTLIPELCHQGIQRFINGVTFVLAQNARGELYSFGDNTLGQLCRELDDPDNSYQKPAMIAAFAGTELIEVSCGYSHALALTSEGNVYAWGANNTGQLGVEQAGIAYARTPTRVYFPNDYSVSAVYCYHNHSFAITSDGFAFSWGQNNSYKLGHDVDGDLRTPQLITRMNQIRSICCTNLMTYLLTADGQLYCCGELRNRSGGNYIHRTPFPLQTYATVQSIARIDSHKWFTEIVVMSDQDDYVHRVDSNMLMKPTKYKCFRDFFAKEYHATYQSISSIYKCPVNQGINDATVPLTTQPVQKRVTICLNNAHVTLPYAYAYGRSDQPLEYIRVDSQKTAFVSEYENISKTYGELNNDVNKLAKGLLQFGIKRGDIIGIWSCNSYNWIKIQYACAKLGIIMCTINPGYQCSELDYVLRRAQIKTLFMPGLDSKQLIINNYHKVLSDVLTMRKTQTNSDPLLLNHVIFMDGTDTQMCDRNKDRVTSSLLSDFCKTDGQLPDSVTESVTPDDPGGTTGKPKGAYLSHHTLASNSWDIDDQDKIFCNPLPFFHAFGGILGNLGMCAFPFKNVIPHFKFNIKHMVDTIIKHECTYMLGTPTMVIDMLDYLETNKIRMDSLKGIGTGGSSMPIEVAHRARKIIPSCFDMRVAYGATEAGTFGTVSDQSDSIERRLETCGRPLFHMETKIVDPKTGNVNYYHVDIIRWLATGEMKRLQGKQLTMLSLFKMT
ncbi:unnamed protein product [Medioppia subpectinata]|uniref:AMP-dependent synthetase/ligase domain-containing protein n=1 Tax=Medioppia subpectinata TaxID=1979941 RepID=A0A7R9Q2I5_9ACAR|nr:unnamed protein product [Medioppia subpectinata]CAG2110220.1 unnamed protein product [Medioppia subpectinata]